MDRRSFIWMTLAALAGTGCVSRSQSAAGLPGSLAPSADVDALYSPGAPAEAKAIFKESTDAAWAAAAPQNEEQRHWMSNTPEETPENAAEAASATGGAKKPAGTGQQVDQPAMPQDHSGQRQPAASAPSAKRQKAPRSPSLPTAPRARTGDIRRAANGVITVHPGEVVQFETQGYCLDPDRPAPSKGEAMRFIPMAGLINFRLRRLFYKVMRMAGSQNTSYAADFQKVVWAIRTADARQNAWGDALAGPEKRLLDAAMPGGAALLQQVRRTATGRKEGGRGLAPLTPGVDFSADSRLHLEQLFNQTPPGSLPHSDAQFSMLSSGVAGRAENLGRLRVRWQIANSSKKDFAFDAAQWALESQRKVQREALPPPSSGLIVKA
ncbi:hypothetical protein [Desulfovibrio sp. SGI.169]|uniref:hypothetical protein n=1 Tax=Desulfovibrio sp. SGI.169 TaxID=3420561 RepID=UPI003CFD8D09